MSAGGVAGSCSCSVSWSPLPVRGFGASETGSSSSSTSDLARFRDFCGVTNPFRSGSTVSSTSDSCGTFDGEIFWDWYVGLGRGRALGVAASCEPAGSDNSASSAGLGTGARRLRLGRRWLAGGGTGSSSTILSTSLSSSSVKPAAAAVLAPLATLRPYDNAASVSHST